MTVSFSLALPRIHMLYKKYSSTLNHCINYNTNLCSFTSFLYVWICSIIQKGYIEVRRSDSIRMGGGLDAYGRSDWMRMGGRIGCEYIPLDAYVKNQELNL